MKTKIAFLVLLSAFSSQLFGQSTLYPSNATQLNRAYLRTDLMVPTATPPT